MQQDFDGDSFTGTPPINTGEAKFSLSGTTKAGETLTIAKTSDDADGINGSYSYQWQRSDDGINWKDVATTTSSYQISESDQGKDIRALISYTDGVGFKEEVKTTPLTIPVPVSVNPPDETAGTISLAKDSEGYAMLL